MFNADTIRAVEELALRRNLPAAALLAVAEVESSGKAFATVDGRKEPLIRWEGHYFDKRLDGEVRETARRQKLASPKAGVIANPKTQAARWRLLARALLIDAQAAYESVSWGVGQVMGAHWEWLGFGSVTALVNLCRRDVAGQIELMALYIEKAGLEQPMRDRQWSIFARGYNGPNFAKDGYHTKIAAAYQTCALKAKPVDDTRWVQERLVAHGAILKVDGIRGRQTDAAIRSFQRLKGLATDGIVGPKTRAALSADPK